MESRSSWNPAIQKGPFTPWGRGEPQTLVVHWVGGGAMGLESQPHSSCRTAVRSIEHYEMNVSSEGYISLAYNVMACPHGILIEGRGLGVQGAANGGGRNSTAASVCVLAGKGDVITSGHYEAIQEARKYFPGRLLPHRAVNNTQCPGDEITAWVEAHADPVGAILEPLVPSQTPSPSPGGNLVAVYGALHRLGSTIKSGRTLKLGDSGTDVADLQFFLLAACAQKISVDGKFGSATRNAVINFQKFFHLTPDGIFGPASRRAASHILSVKFP
ncbi:Peptidoglycan binding-like [uncultured Caudovirales phage]|uniref:Peptidoglycan binding-like n=1 Tax=uncultured Caudovirales phage TaxID=2100421 RepID=A0A6J5Q3P3_9CAUD|nr:Peptidoglycan binding-like [uncultured Caudovirales phage]